MKLQLPTQLKGVHPIVSVTNICPHLPDEIAECTADPHPGPEIIDGEEEYEVERILNSKYRYGKLWYFIKFSGWPNSENELLPQKSLEHSTELIVEFHESHPSAPGHRRARETQKPRHSATSRQSGIEEG